MIMPSIPKPKNIKVLCIGMEIFEASKPPDELDVEPIFISFDRITQITSDKIPLNEAIMDKVNQVSAIMAIPQPYVKNFCTSPWLVEISKKKPVGLIWYDYNIFYDTVHNLENCFHIILDTQEFDKHNMMSIWTPLRGSLGSPYDEKTIGISFLGSVDCDQRKEGLSFIINKGIPIFVAGNEWSRVEYSTLYHYMKSSKIILNFANNRFHPDTHRQGLKGRVLEAMIAGAMVLENENFHTAKYFEGGEDIVFYKDNDDMCDKIRYYLDNNGERIRIAANGQKLCETKYTIHNWWKMVIPRLLKFKSKLAIF